MKKSIIILIAILSIFIVGCSDSSDNFSVNAKTEIKETIDLVLTYESGYDEIIKKHVSEKNFYICNYVEFYSNYIGEVTIRDYQSEIISIEEDQGRYVVCMILNIKATSIDEHTHDDGSAHEGGSDEVIGEEIPVEVILKERNGELYIEGFTEYENLEKAKELNEGFNKNL